MKNKLSNIFDELFCDGISEQVEVKQHKYSNSSVISSDTWTQQSSIRIPNGIRIIKIPNKLGGKCKEHENAPKELQSFEYEKKIGNLEIDCTDTFPRMVQSAGVKDPKYTVGIHVDIDIPNGLDHHIAQGSIEECSDEMVSYLVRLKEQLDGIEKNIDDAINFFSNTMLGNGDLAEQVYRLEKMKKEIEEKENSKE